MAKTGLASGRLLQQGGRDTAQPTASRPRPSSFRGRKLGGPTLAHAKSQDARRPIIAASPVVFQLRTSTRAAEARRRVRQFGRSEKAPLSRAPNPMQHAKPRARLRFALRPPRARPRPRAEIGLADS